MTMSMSISNEWGEEPADAQGADVEVPTEGPGAVDAPLSLLFANSADYLFEFGNAPTRAVGAQAPSHAFTLLGGVNVDVSITNVESSSDSSVRYCLSLKHIAPQLGAVDRKYNSSGSDRWSVWRRYSDFDKLNTQLNALYVVPPVSLPPKTAFSMTGMTSFSEPNARRDGLVAYLRSAIDCVMNAADADREAYAEGRMSSLNPMELLSNFNIANKAAATGDARILLARFLDNEHDRLTIRK
jgi:hypothetical protein